MLREVTVDREHRETVDEGPTTEDDIARGDASRAFVGRLHETGLDELVGLLGRRSELRVAILRVRQGPEHEPEFRGIPRGEQDVSHAHGKILAPGVAALAIRRFPQLSAERAKAVLGDRREQRVTIGEVVIGRAVRHAREASRSAQGKPLLPVLLDQSTGRLDERAAQIAVVVVRPLSFQVDGLMPRVITDANRSTQNLASRPSRRMKALGFLSAFAMRKRAWRTFARSPSSRGT